MFRTTFLILFSLLFITIEAQCPRRCMPRAVANRRCARSGCKPVSCNDRRNRYRCESSTSSTSAPPTTTTTTTTTPGNGEGLCGKRCYRFRSGADRDCRGTGSVCNVQRCDLRRSQGYICAESKVVPQKCPEVCGPLDSISSGCDAAKKSGAPCEIRACSDAVGEYVCIDKRKPKKPTEVTNLGVGTTIDLSFPLNVEPGSGTPSEDLYFLVDITNGQQAAINALASGLNNIVSARTAVSSNVRFGLGVYNGQQGSAGFSTKLAFTSDSNSLQTQLNSLTTVGGSNGGNAATLEALYSVAQSSIGWENVARKIVVLVGGKAGYEPTCVGNRQINRNHVLSVLKNRQISLVSMNLGGLNSAPQAGSASCGGPVGTPGSNQASHLTDGTGGKLVSVSTVSNLPSQVISAIGNLKQTINLLELDCQGALKFIDSPRLPIILAPGESVKLAVQVIIQQAICNRPNPFICAAAFTGDGALFFEVPFVVSNVAGC